MTTRQHASQKRKPQTKPVQKEPRSKLVDGLEYEAARKCQKVAISLERKLLARVDRYADHHGLTRSGLLSISVSMFIDELLVRRQERHGNEDRGSHYGVRD